MYSYLDATPSCYSGNGCVFFCICCDDISCRSVPSIVNIRGRLSDSVVELMIDMDGSLRLTIGTVVRNRGKGSVVQHSRDKLCDGNLIRSGVYRHIGPSRRFIKAG